MAAMVLADEIFWTEPPNDDDARPTDPLGLDGMREELSDRLVPCLTGRTWRHEDFFWSLVFMHWVREEGPTEEARANRFLSWERCLKLHWAHCGRSGFAGVKRARNQAGEPGAPSVRFRPLLENQRAQGLLGAHLGPLRKLGLVSETALSLTEKGLSLIAGAGPAPQLVDGNWKVWKGAFDRAEKAFGADFKRQLRKRLAEKMPDLYAALESRGWQKSAAWKKAAQHIGAIQRPYALLAEAFCPWADLLREQFHAIVQSSPKEPAPVLPPPLAQPIPRGLKRWEPLRSALRHWRGREADRVLADLHNEVFTERGYERDLWICWEDGRRMTYPGRASLTVVPEGSDCRWANAVQLMRPGQ
jgi:hypothetical protein